MKREHGNYRKDECDEEKRVGNEARKSLSSFYLIRAECSEPLPGCRAAEMLWFNNNSPHRSSEPWKEAESNAEQSHSFIHHLHHPADARPSVTVSQIRATEVWTQMRHAETGAWSMATYVEQSGDMTAEGCRGSRSPRGAFQVCPAAHKKRNTEKDTDASDGRTDASPPFSVTI